LQLDQTSEDSDRLECLIHELGMTTKAQVVRAAIRLLGMWQEAAKRGAKLEIVEQDGTRTRVFIL
jgi:hypothetical protein